MKVKKYLNVLLLIIILLAVQTIYFEYTFSKHTQRLLNIQIKLTEDIDGLNYRIQEIENEVAFVSKRSFVNSHKIPKSIRFCGEKLNLDDPVIREKVEREFYSILSKQGQIQLYLKRIGRYNNLIESHLKKAGLPLDLKYLAIHESALLPKIRSRSRAVGLWQFMSATARLYKLKVNNYLDERRDPEKATPAAIRFLGDLHQQFGNWALALAAYNGGPTRIKRAIDRQNTDDFYSLTLPEETERYYFKIIATKIIVSNSEKYGFKMDRNDYYRPHKIEKLDFTVFETKKSLDEIAKICNLPISTVKDLNPAFRSSYLPSGKYTLNIPKYQYAVSQKNYNSYKDSYTILAKLDNEESPEILVD